MPDNLMPNDTITNSIVSQGHGALGGAVEARRVRDSWTEDRFDALRAAHTDEEMAEGFGHASERLADQSESLSVQAERNAAAISLAIEKTAAAAALAAATNTGSILLDSTKNAAASALAAATNTAAIQAALAECCCELKELIRADGGQTRDLINATTLQGVRDELADQKAQNAISKILQGKIV